MDLTPSGGSTAAKDAGEPSSSTRSSLLNMSWSCSNLSDVVRSASRHVAINAIVGAVGRSQRMPVLNPGPQHPRLRRSSSWDKQSVETLTSVRVGRSSRSNHSRGSLSQTVSTSDTRTL